MYDAPEKDGPRLALAARLTDAGDPRGEFITLHMNRRAGKVTKREQDLEKEHGRAWLGEIEGLLEKDVVFERGLVAEATVVGGTSGGWYYRVLPTGAGTQREWSTLRRLTLAGHESPGLLSGARTQRIPELFEVGRGHLNELLKGPARPQLLRLELANARQRSAHTGESDVLSSKLPEKFPSLESLQIGARADGIPGVEKLVERLPNLRELAVGSAEPELIELVALARRRKLEKVHSLGLTDFTFTLSTGVLEIAFNGIIHPKQASIAEETLANARDLGITRVLVRVPPRAKIEPDAKGRPAKIKRRSESLPLCPILEVVESLGLKCEFDVAK